MEGRELFWGRLHRAVGSHLILQRAFRGARRFHQHRRVLDRKSLISGRGPAATEEVLMRFLRNNRFGLRFLAMLVFYSVMVIWQINANQSKRAELREAFLRLQSKGCSKQADPLYQRLLRDLETAPDKSLLDELQRTSPLVDPNTQQPDNLVWKYHRSLRRELEKRWEKGLFRALKMADEEK